MNDNYGYSLSNPIQLVSIPESYEFFAQLLTIEGEPIEVERKGSRQAPNCKGLIDTYIIKANKQTVTLYVYPYAEVSMENIPKGFMLESDWYDKFFDDLGID